MSKMENIELICMKLQGLTKVNFQNQLGRVLDLFYRSKNLTYEMPSPNGGDDKNDGWVVEEALFYQVYSPNQMRTGLAKDMQKKFSEDLTGLLRHLQEGKWNGKINKYIFLVNTFDEHLPKDPNRFYFQTVEKLKLSTGFNFDYEIVNLSYLKRLLFTIENEEIFDLMKSELSIFQNLPTDIFTDKNMYTFLNILGGKIMDSTVVQNRSDYTRISSKQKIEINQLGDIAIEINNILNNLSVVTAAVNELNKDIETSQMFAKIVDYVISCYYSLSKEYIGVELFNQLCYAIAKMGADSIISAVPAKYLVVYIFDLCDIFKKER